MQQWTQMVTIQTMMGLNKVSPEQFLVRIAQLGKDFCDGHGVEKISFRSVNGYETLGMLHGCGSNKSTKKGELTLFRVIRGNDSLYVIQKAWKTAPYDPSIKPPIETDEIKKTVNYLATAMVCDTRKSTCPQGIK